MVKYFYIFWYFGNKGRSGSKRRQNAAKPKRQSFITNFVVYMHRYVPLVDRMFAHLKKTRCAADADRPDVFQSGSSSSIPPFPYRQAASFSNVVQGVLRNQQSELRETTMNDSLVRIVTVGECEMNTLPLNWQGSAGSDHIQEESFSVARWTSGESLQLPLRLRLRVILHTYTHTNILTYMYAWFPWFHKCVTETVGCRTCYKYSNIQFTV